MKNFIFVLTLALGLFAFGCLSNPSPTSPNVSVTPIKKCVETENGINYSGIEYSNYCVSTMILKSYSCEDGEIISSSETLCTGGSVCIDSKCVGSSSSQSNNSTTQELPMANTTSIPNSSISQNNDLCSDSDFGQNPTLFGIVRFNGTDFSDSCNANFDVNEYFCTNDTVGSRSISCGTGNPCKNGACTSSVLTCSDSNSNSQFSFGTANQYRSGIVSNNFTDFCIDSGKKLSFICQGGIVKNETISCPFGSYCKSGACIGNCVDSDGGLRYLTSGSAKSAIEEKFDFCSDQDTLVEYHCSENSITNSTYGCGGPCADGKCLQRSDVRCTENDFGVDLYYATQKVYSLSNTCNSKSSAKEYSCDGNYFTTDSDSCTNNQVCYQGQCQSIRELGCVDYHGSPVFENEIAVPDEDNDRKVYSDYCRNSSELVRYSCENGRYNSTLVTCPSNQVCQDGECVVN